MSQMNLLYDMPRLSRQMHSLVDFNDADAVREFTEGGFNMVGENYLMAHRIPTSLFSMIAPELCLLGPRGIVKMNIENGFDVIYGGTPHHGPHVIGYWHINDVDEISVFIKGDTPESMSTIIAVNRCPRPGERDMFAWYCWNCLNLLYCHVYNSGESGEDFQGFLKEEDLAVGTFNADQKLRTCKECGTEHPLGYRSIQSAGTESPEEQAARFQW